MNGTTTTTTPSGFEDFVAKLKNGFSDFATWWKGTTIGAEIDNAAKAAIAELEGLSSQDLENVAATTATAVLANLGGGTGAAIAAGITAAEAGFKVAAAQVSTQTIATFATTIHNQVAANQSVTAAAAAAASSASGSAQ